MALMKYLSCLAVAGLLLTACSTTETEPIVPADDQCHFTETGTAAREVSFPPSPNEGMVTMKLVTNQGEIEMNLDGTQAPCAVGTLEHLAKEGFYDNTLCHRITTDNIYILQCGDPSASGSGGPGFTFKDEFPVGSGEQGLYHAGVIAMANAGPDTNGSQFFFAYEDSPLPPNYTIVGQVAEPSMEILRGITAKGATDSARDAAPAEEVRIEQVVL